MGYSQKSQKQYLRTVPCLYLLGTEPRLGENCKNVGEKCYILFNHKGRVEMQIKNGQLLYKLILNMALSVVYLKFKFNLAFCILLANYGGTAPFDAKRMTQRECPSWGVA